MQRLVWVDSGGVRCFGCAGCKWTYPVQEFSPEFSEAELVEDFHDHSCDDPRFRDKTAAESLPSLQLGDSDRPSVDSKRILQDLCGLKGAVLASIESLPSDDPGTDGLEQIKAELDRVRSLLWLHMNSSKEPAEEHSRSGTTVSRR